MTSFVSPFSTIRIVQFCGKQRPVWFSATGELFQNCRRSKSSSLNPVEAAAVQRAAHDHEKKASSDRNVQQVPVDVSSEESDLSQPLVYDARKVDPTTVKQVFYFDTLELSKILETHGFSRSQAEGLSQSLVDIINSTLAHQTRHMVTKPQQEITVQQLMSEISAVKKDMVILQKSEFSSLRNETEKQTFEISQVKDQLKDEVSQLQGKMTLDINLERSRAVEAHAKNETHLQQLHNKIETEIANLRTIYEQYRNDVYKYAGGTVLTCAGLCLGIIRMWSH